MASGPVDFGSKKYTLDIEPNPDLLEKVNSIVMERIKAGLCWKDASGAINIPVKLSIAELAPMLRVENIVMTLARVGLVNVQYTSMSKLASNFVPSPTKKSSIKEKISVHAKSTPAGPLFHLADKDFQLDELEHQLKEINSGDKIIQVRVSYEAETVFQDVLKVFKACSATGISECGLVPLRTHK